MAELVDWDEMLAGVLGQIRGGGCWIVVWLGWVDDLRDGPQDEHEYHAGCGDEEESAATEAIDDEGGADGDDELHDGVAAVELGGG